MSGMTSLLAAMRRKPGEKRVRLVRGDLQPADTILAAPHEIGSALGPAALAIVVVFARGRRSADPIGGGLNSDLPYSAKNDHGQPKQHRHGYPPFPCRSNACFCITSNGK